MTSLQDLLNEIICGGLYYGTTLCKDDSCAIYWSPAEWVSPNDGCAAQPERWLYLGHSGWWSNAEQKRMYISLSDELGDDFPNSPREWVYFDNRPSVKTVEPCI